MVPLVLAKYYMGRAAETEGHILEAFRLSPRDIDAYRWMRFVAWPSYSSARMPKPSVGYDEAWRPTAIILSPILRSPLPWACSARWMRRETAAKAGLALSPDFTIRACAPTNTATIRFIALDESASAWACASPGCLRGDVGDGLKVQVAALLPASTIAGSISVSCRLC